MCVMSRACLTRPAFTYRYSKKVFHPSLNIYTSSLSVSRMLSPLLWEKVNRRLFLLGALVDAGRHDLLDKTNKWQNQRHLNDPFLSFVLFTLLWSNPTTILVLIAIQQSQYKHSARRTLLPGCARFSSHSVFLDHISYKQ